MSPQLKRPVSGKLVFSVWDCPEPKLYLNLEGFEGGGRLVRTGRSQIAGLFVFVMYGDSFDFEMVFIRFLFALPINFIEFQYIFNSFWSASKG